MTVWDVAAAETSIHGSKKTPKIVTPRKNKRSESCFSNANSRDVSLPDIHRDSRE